jgi:macrodomain Ter protein organizer (MatP/YcbG family)
MTKRVHRPLTNAERQAAFRARKADTGEGHRLSVMAHPTVAAGLKRLARHYRVTQSDTLLRMVQDAEHEAVKDMKPTDQKRYYRVTRQRLIQSKPQRK